MRWTLAVLLLAPAFVRAAPGDGLPPEKEPKKEVRCSGTFGFSGLYRPGGWVPVHVNLENDTDDDLALEISSSLDYGERGAGGRFSRSLDLPHGARKAVFLYVRSPRILDGVGVECRSPRGPVCGAELGTQTPVLPGRAFLLVSGN